MSIEYVQLQLASPSEIKRWSQRILPTGEVVGEISKADTINYRTFKPERGGLFCERIFGSTSNGECSCGKTKRRKLIVPVNFNRLTLQKRNAELEATQAIIEKPVAHMWYFRNSPNVLAALLNMRSQEIDETIHFQTYTPSKYGTQNYCLHGGVQWYVNHWEPMHPYFAGDIDVSMDKAASWNSKSTFMPSQIKTIENCGGEALQELLTRLDLVFLQRMLSRKLKNTIEKKKLAAKSLRKRHKRRKTAKLLGRTDQKNYGITIKVREYSRRLEFIRSLARKGLRPEWMILSIFPVLPPDLRPMIQMSSGRFATSDLNDLYRRLIYRKIRFEKFLTLFDEEFLPDLLIRHDLCLLQEAADSIIDNGRLDKPAQRPNRKPFKSLTSIIEGKHGRFRQNLLGKRVDYSGRSVIVVGPKLRLHQCGLPREMALELFQPFVIRALLEESGVKNIRAAKNLLQRRSQMVWDILDTVVLGHPVLLNRAPTLHRLGIQAFEPILLSGRAIQLHPLVCPAFNADFDGDQMAVHVPLGLEAQAEARLLMLATHNWLSPATGEPSILPSQDMILGFYYLTTLKPTSVLHAYETSKVDLHEIIWLRWSSYIQTTNSEPLQITVNKTGHVTTVYDSFVMQSDNSMLSVQMKSRDTSSISKVYNRLTSLNAAAFYILTTPGRVLFNNLIYENLFL
ncbi:DNA-directed RNA polymerase subunit beta [Ostreococcus tauri]|uniref:DNA-directed RNA polymerase subunit n=1 Tax=Ostreococcus tauri TaxID=70448 RepID=A0A1Y5I853_OSTTA|nr:DNA-directed RNA polymerase subunit beta [Ostreococcus tauri]